MFIDNKGPLRDITIARFVVLIIDMLKAWQQTAEDATISECIHNLDDFLWSFAGFATDNGDEKACDEFLKNAGYND